MLARQSVGYLGERDMFEIRSEPEYRARFRGGEENSPRRPTALELALDIRKFEIELYWKRASYFWTLIAASFAGYFSLQSSASATARGLIPLVSCLGFLLSLGWYLVNRGSKYWQENWERHVDLLESGVVGPLYKTTISREEFPMLRFWGGYPYSVSKINQLISLFVALVWLGLIVGTFPALPKRECLLAITPWLLIGLTLAFSVLLLTLGVGGSEGRPRRITSEKARCNQRARLLTPPKQRLQVKGRSRTRSLEQGR
jgi:hypothetical protein